MTKGPFDDAEIKDSLPGLRQDKQADRRLASQSFASGLPGLRVPHLTPNERSAA